MAKGRLKSSQDWEVKAVAPAWSLEHLKPAGRLRVSMEESWVGPGQPEEAQKAGILSRCAPSLSLPPSVPPSLPPPHPPPCVCGVYVFVHMYVPGPSSLLMRVKVLVRCLLYLSVHLFRQVSGSAWGTLELD